MERGMLTSLVLCANILVAWKHVFVSIVLLYVYSYIYAYLHAHILLFLLSSLSNRFSKIETRIEEVGKALVVSRQGMKVS